MKNASLLFENLIIPQPQGLEEGTTMIRWDYFTAPIEDLRGITHSLNLRKGRRDTELETELY